MRNKIILTKTLPRNEFCLPFSGRIKLFHFIVNVKVNFTLELTMKAQRGSRCTGHTQNNGAVFIVFTIKTAPFFCVCPVYVYSFFNLDVRWVG
jgi:hypothetical protein